MKLSQDWKYKHQVRIELSNQGLLVLFANYYFILGYSIQLKHHILIFTHIFNKG